MNNSVSFCIPLAFLPSPSLSFVVSKSMELDQWVDRYRRQRDEREMRETERGEKRERERWEMERWDREILEFMTLRILSSLPEMYFSRLSWLWPPTRCFTSRIHHTDGFDRQGSDVLASLISPGYGKLDLEVQFVRVFCAPLNSLKNS